MVYVYAKFKRVHNLRWRVADVGNLWDRYGSAISIAAPNPHNSLAFACGKHRHGDLIQIHRVLVNQSRNGHAPTINPESPAVIATYNLIALNPPLGKGNTPMRTNVSQRENLPTPCAPKNYRRATDFPVDQFAEVKIS